MEDLKKAIQALMPKGASPDLTISTMTLTELKAEKINSTSGDMEGLHCDICNDKGYIAVVKNNNLVMRECECMAKRRSLNRIKRSGLSDLIEEFTFDEYKTPEKWQQSAKQAALEYIADGIGHWFVITGTPGTGKTHICTAICGALMNVGKEIRYMLWRDEAPKLKAMVNDRYEYERIMDKLKSVDVLYIDDFFKTDEKDSITGKVKPKYGVTSGDINLAFELLNSRYNTRNSMTIISTEKDIKKLLEIDEAIGSRIYERSKGFCIKTPEQNWRLR